MKLVFALIALSLLAATFSRFFTRSKEAPMTHDSMSHRIGGDPGDIRTSSDILASAHKRGNDLAVFAAG
jgi:hypothetical protein